MEMDESRRLEQLWREETQPARESMVCFGWRGLYEMEAMGTAQGRVKSERGMRRHGLEIHRTSYDYSGEPCR